MKSILILYHKNCPDGFGAAWAAWKKFGDKADYFAVEYRWVPKEKYFKNRKEIYTLDFCYHRPVLEKLLRINPNITVIDHHITAQSSVKMAKNYSYALNHSGAILAWKYFHPRKTTPRLLKYIEDFDLWKFKMPLTREVSVILEFYNNFNFKIFDKIAKDFENFEKRKRYMKEGKLLLAYKENIIKRIVGGVEKAKFEKKKVYVVNSPFWQSEVGNYIVKNKKTIAVIWSRKSGKINVSLRSNGKTDVSKLALKYGGGGHRAASGFSFDVDKPLPWKNV